MATKKTPSRATTATTMSDPVAALTEDHNKVKALFKQFEKLKEQDDAEEEKVALVKRICTELKVHAEIEEEVFYPAVRAKIDDDDLMDEALVEHAGAKELIAQLEAMEPGDDLYDAKVTVLGEQIQHHVKEEEGEMFPKARKAKVNTPELAERLAERKAAVQATLGADDEEAGAGAVPPTGRGGAKSRRNDKGMAR
jgi:hemerythrin-like domain-containing protein